MAIGHFTFTPRRVAQGQSGKAVAQYLMREGQYAPKQREVGYLTRTAPTSKNRQDLRHVETRNLPSWAQGNAATFFAKAQQHERVNGRYAYAVQLALPRELTHEQHLALAQDFLEAVMPDNPVLWVKHEPIAIDGELQPHIHILMSPRLVDMHVRLPAQTFGRWNATEPERGGMRKDPFWLERGAVQQVRFAWADLTNFHLERAGHTARLDPRRGPSMDSAAWEQRKASKGINDMQDISREEFVLLVRGWTRDYERGTALPRASHAEVMAYHVREQTRLREEAQDVEQSIRTHTAELRILTQSLEREQAREPAVPSQGRRPTLGRLRRGHHHEEQVGAGYRVRLHEDAYERETGYGR